MKHLTHLTHYLPFNLMGVWGDNMICSISYINLERNEIKWRPKNKADDRYVLRENCKPILRRRDNMTMDIFIDAFYERFGGGFKDRTGFINAHLDDLCNQPITQMPHGFVMLFFELHFDVFGLIDNGDAVDINTIRTLPFGPQTDVTC